MVILEDHTFNFFLSDPSGRERADSACSSSLRIPLKQQDYAGYLMATALGGVAIPPWWVPRLWALSQDTKSPQPA